MILFILLEGSLLDVNPGTVIWTAVSFLILVFVLGKYAWGPIISSLNAREKKITDSLVLAQKASDDARQSSEKSQAVLAKAYHQSEEILKEVKDKADKLRQELEVKAKQDADKILQNALAEIDKEKQNAKNELRSEVAFLAIQAAEMLLKEELKDKDAKQKKILQNVIDGISRN